MVSSSNTSPRPTSTCKWGGTGVGTIKWALLSPTPHEKHLPLADSDSDRVKEMSQRPRGLWDNAST